MGNEHKPIRRSEQLKGLSREHHEGLLFCWKIREGLRIGVSGERLTGYMNYFMNEHLIDHFEKEEKLLFNIIDDPVCLQAKKEHSLLIDHIQTINLSPSISSGIFIDLVEMLGNHIRFEERVAFPLLEEILNEQMLNSINDELERTSHKFNDEYPDKFWL